MKLLICYFRNECNRISNQHLDVTSSYFLSETVSSASSFDSYGSVTSDSFPYAGDFSQNSCSSEEMVCANWPPKILYHINWLFVFILNFL